MGYNEAYCSSPVADVHGTLAATCVVVANNAKSAINTWAKTLQSCGHPVWVCDGTADNVEIQAAIDALPAGGGSVILLEGQFNINATIVLRPYTSFIGQGYDATTIYLTNGADCNMIAGAISMPEASRLGLYVGHLTLNGNRANQTANSDGMSFQDYKNCMFEFIRINNCYRYGFYQGGSGSTTFQFQLNWVYVNNSGSDGMQLFGSNNVLLQVFSNLNLRDGIVLSGGYENVLIHPDVESNTRYGIWVINEHNDEIFAAAAGSNGSRGIYLYYSTDCKVIGGVFSSNTGSGIAVTSSGSVLARRNHIIEAQLTGNTRYGIEEADFGAGVPTQNVYKNNRISGNTEGPLLIVGTSNAYDQTPMAIALNLTGGATDIEVFHANAPCVLVGYTILYSVATGGGAGVNIRVGRYQDGVALDDDYFDISASELNKAKGYSKHFVTADLTQTVIAAGDTITVGTAGGKADTGEVILILKIAEMGD